MDGRLRILTEAKDLSCFKLILRLFNDYYDAFPGIASTYLDATLERGMKIMPKDKQALCILELMVSGKESVPTKFQKFINARFSDLDKNCRPIHKCGRKLSVAYWNQDGRISDKVVDLLDFKGGKTGFWCDGEGNKVTLFTQVNNKEEK